MNKRMRVLSVFVLLLAAVACRVPALTQLFDSSPDDPIMGILTIVPDNDDSRQSYISYANYDAVIQVWADTTASGFTKEELDLDSEEEALLEEELGIPFDTSSESEIVRATYDYQWRNDDMYFTPLANLNSGADISGFIRDALPGGIATADLAQSLVCGHPPELCEVLVAQFEIEDVQAGYEELGYITDELGTEGYLLCLSGDCDSGFEPDIENRILHTNIFGFNLGRSQPVILTENMLISASCKDCFEGLVDVYSGKISPLAESDDILSYIEFLSDYGTIAQMFIVSDVGDYVMMPASWIDSRVTDELLDALAEFETFPPYKSFAIANVFRMDAEYTFVLFLYESEDDANKAVEVVPERMTNYECQLDCVLGEMLTDRGMENFEAKVISNSSTGYYLTAIIMKGDLPEPDGAFLTELGIEHDYDDTPLAYHGAGMLYRTLMTMIAQRDVGWLAAEFDLDN